MLLITATLNRSSESLPTSSSARSAESTHGSYLADQPETGGVSPSGVNHGCVPVTGAVAAVDAVSGVAAPPGLTSLATSLSFQSG
jgi:hypothetical protein